MTEAGDGSSELRLSVLDQSPVAAGSTPREALANTLDLARAADRAGYHRYWMSEHHGGGGVAGTSPEILSAAVAMATENLRVGSGGVLLSHYSPLKVAESFLLLEALFPGRIDLGIGRGAGGPPATVEALRPRGAREPFPTALRALIGHLDGGSAVGAGPELWLLGSSESAALQAAELGLPFCFAHFIAPEGLAAIDAYRDRFRSSDRCESPRVGVAVIAVCAATGEEADVLATSFGLWRLGLERGRPGPVPTVEEAAAHRYTEAERERLVHLREQVFIGAPQDVAARLTPLAARHAAEELVVLTVCHDHRARVRSYELLAGELL